mgnify:CR=1 FL=1
MKKQNGITLIALVISIIVMLILAGVSINAVIGDNGVISKAQETLYLQSCAVLEEYLQMEVSNYVLEENPYETQYGMLRAKHPGWFYQNAQGYILDSGGHVLYLIRKTGLPQEIQSQIKGGDASRVSQYYKQQDVYGVTSDLQVYYCNNGTDTILGLTVEDLDKDSPLEIAYDDESLLSKVINGTNEEGKANEPLSMQDLKGIKSLTIDTTEKLALLSEFDKLPTLQKVYFKNITIPTLEGMQNAPTITDVRFTNCSVSDYSALCGLTNLNVLYLITPTGKNADVAALCSSDKGIATAEFSNLKYFGITGVNSAIQSTDYSRYSTTRYNITDISGLANLSDITKQAIEHLSLHNLQLTSIESLSGFTNVVHLRLECSALTSFNGIQNMSKLQYLFAPSQYSNANQNYPFGINESDSLANAETDALSYIYKNQDGKNTSLKLLNLKSSSNLKYVTYLSSCTALTNLQLDGCSSIKDVSTISAVIARCGSSYSLPSAVTKNIITSNSKVLNLNGLTLTTEEFEQIKNGSNPNTALTHLSLASIKITKDGVQLTGTALNEEINSVLRTCTGMQYLQLYNISGLSTIEFVKLEYDSNGKVIAGMPNIKELDLRNTSVRTNAGDKTLNGLELLEDLVQRDSNGNITRGVRQMSLTGNNIDFSYLQKTVSCLDGGSYWIESGWNYGLWSNSWTSLKTLEKCSELTYLRMYWHNNNPFGYDANKVLDLSNCINLKDINTCRFVNKIILPENLKTVFMQYDHRLPDFSNCSKLESLELRFNSSESHTDEAYNEFLSKFNNLVSLKKLIMHGCEITDFTNLGLALPYMTKLESIDLQYYSWATIKNTTGLKNLEPLVSAKSIPTLKSLTIGYADNCTNLDWISELEQLENLTIAYTKISSVPDLSKLTKLTTATLNNNRITDISGLEKAYSITSLNLQNNALYDMTYTASGSGYYTLALLADLNQKQLGKLKKLYLSGNSIEDFSMLNDSNLVWESKSGW